MEGGREGGWMESEGGRGKEEGEPKGERGSRGRQVGGREG